MFTTPVHPSSSSHKISRSHRLFCIGSCFAQRMGQRWTDHKFTTLVNPFGTLYNPVSVFQLMQYALDGQLPDTATYPIREGQYVHYDFHSDIHATSPKVLRETIQRTLQQAQAFLPAADWIVITLGSAFGYELLETGQLVASCHKQPAHLFRKRLLTVEEMIESFATLKTRLDAINPHVHYLFTVSPVRHLRDTLERNSVSKALLRLATEQLRQSHPERIHYFPSYEIMMDELRDYRYYEADMIHPSPVAEDYIWSKLTDTYLDEEAKAFLAQWTKIKRAMNHRPFHPGSESHQRFLRNTLMQLKQLSQNVDVYTEIAQIEQQLKPT